MTFYYVDLDTDGGKRLSELLGARVNRIPQLLYIDSKGEARSDESPIPIRKDYVIYYVNEMRALEFTMKVQQYIHIIDISIYLYPFCLTRL